MKVPTVGIPAYPEEIERWWWRKATEKWPEAGEPKVLRFLQEEIVAQSDRFNKERLFSPRSYGSRDTSILAYGNFYFPRTWAQLAYVLSEAHDFRSWRPPGKGPLRILDLGCGSGATGLSALTFLRERNVKNPIELCAIDYSGKSLGYLRNLHRSQPGLWPNVILKTERADLRQDLPSGHGQEFDLILIGSALNEIIAKADYKATARKIVDLGSRLKPGGFLIVLEPALQEVSNCLHQAAALITREGKLHLHAPYFNGLPCPFAETKSRYHSHEVRPGEAPKTTHKLNAPLGLNLHDLKFSFVLLSVKKPRSFEKTPGTFRLVSPVAKRKGLYFFVGIAVNGKEHIYEIQTRDLMSGDKELIEGWQRGDILKLQKYEILGDGHRIRISDAEAIEPLFVPR